MKPKYFNLVKLFAQVWKYDLAINPFSYPKLAEYTGTGFVINNKGKKYIITCNHVVENARYVSGNFNGKKESLKIIYQDYISDIAILSCPFKDAKPLKLGTIETGDKVICQGFPLRARGISVTTGVISKITKEVYFHRFYKGLVLHTDALILPGNSGGPALNEKSEVIGIVFMGGNNIGMIIPFFNLDHILSIFKTDRKTVPFRQLDISWQIKDGNLTIADNIVTHIDNVKLHDGGQIMYKDFLNYYGYKSKSDEQISFQYLVSLKKEKTITFKSSGGPIKVELDDLESPYVGAPFYFIVGGFVFVELTIREIENSRYRSSDLYKAALAVVVNTDHNKDYTRIRKTTVKSINGHDVNYMDDMVNIFNSLMEKGDLNVDVTIKFNYEHRDITMKLKHIVEDSKMIIETMPQTLSFLKN